MKIYKGFTLIEIVLLCFIISFILINIFNIQNRAIEINKIVKEKEEAFYIARSICEMFKSSNLKIPIENMSFCGDDVNEISNKFINLIEDEHIVDNRKKYRVTIKNINCNYMDGIDVSVFSIKKEFLIRLLVLK
ncbi:type II secretion system protein [Caloramator sp. E03]|uniref:type II secretion system protein n=1 Tax=Caloramator sp. E03 TaxID=2576307 RepID=UPI0011105261|nr:type II secretion system protein [Caloramator sp. E03]QCX32716.1 type II secretion system protein [Caloramator sp. E03]